MKFTYELTEAAQLDEILEIYAAARRFMQSSGNPQWDAGFPGREEICGWIKERTLYAVTAGGGIAALFMAVDHDPDYDRIEGSWLTQGGYLAVHRVAVAEASRGTGAAKYILETAAPEIARRRGKQSLRIDTHEKNVPMRGLLSHLQFTPCGIIHLSRDRSARLAFEKKVRV